jgi:hypothetical protein
MTKGFDSYLGALLALTTFLAIPLHNPVDVQEGAHILQVPPPSTFESSLLIQSLRLIYK